MRIPFYVTMIALVVVALCLAAIARQNDTACFGQHGCSFSTFKRSNQINAGKIIAFWKKNPDRKEAIKKLIRIDYALMLVYTLYFFLLINYYRKRKEEDRRGLKKLLFISLITLVIATLLKALQDYKIYNYLDAADLPGDMRFYTYAGWGLYAIALIPLAIALLPADTWSKAFIGRIFHFISQILKSVWLFFPGIIFLILPIFCFWILGQGKDIIVAFINNNPSFNHLVSFNYFRLIFFIAIAFWVYVGWYSSRIISYIKKKQQFDLEVKMGKDVQLVEAAYEDYSKNFELSKTFLDAIPRLIGNACFLILELAVLQSPVLYKSITLAEAWLFFFIGMVILWNMDAWITKRQNPGKLLYDEKYNRERKIFRTTFHVLLCVFLGLMIITSFYGFNGISLWILFGLLILLHVVFVFYINLRRVALENEAPKAKYEAEHENKERRTLLKILMDYFCVPRREIGYFRWFIIIIIAAVIFYLGAIFNLGFARGLGPFPLVILAFGVLLIFGNIVTAFSVKYMVNFHVLLFLLALLLGLKETHEVRTITLKQSNRYPERPDLKTYLTAWLKDKNLSSDTTYDTYFVMSNGGASRSGYWTAAVLGKIEDSTLLKNNGDRFSDHLFCLSGTSGGGVGVATFFSLLQHKAVKQEPLYTASAKEFLKQDYFTYTFARMLGPDFFNYIFHFSATQDRGAAMESSFEKSAANHSDSNTYKVPFDTTLSSFTALKDGELSLPVLFVNTTRMQDGNPGVVTNLNLTVNQDIFNKRVDVVHLLDSNKDISIASGSILGARFPYLSPAGRIANDYYVDGGYFDNSGAGVVQEIIRGILQIAKDDTSGVLREKIRRLNFKVLHIVNSPVGFAAADTKSVAPIKNDLMSPILTIVGAYNEQTTVNDGRLKNYLQDINKYEANRASYTQISLYELPWEWLRDPLRKRFRSEPPYAMNWFMSDTTISRINNRLETNPAIKIIIDSFNAVAPIKK